MADELDDVTLRAASRGDISAFRRLYEFYAPFVWRAVYRMVNGDQAMAEQVVQDVFVRAHRSLRKFRFQSAFSTWLYRIGYNQALTALSRREAWRRRMRPLADDVVTPSGLERIEAHDRVERVLARLTADERFLLVAREVDGVPFEELAAIVGRNAGALRTQISRMKESIRRGEGS